MSQALTPIRHQYLRIKQKYPEAIVFFRLGDFYEAFDDDAEIISQELEIVLTSRTMGKGHRYPMAGIPHHALENYLARLISKGHKVAICEQTSEPTPGKGIVQRDVVRVVTPGTVVEPNLLHSGSNNYLAALVIEAETAGIAYVDITTGEFATTQLAADRVTAELERLNFSELVVSRDGDIFDLPVDPTRLDPRWFELPDAHQSLLNHFDVDSLEGYGCAYLPMAVRAAGAIIHYLGETQKDALTQLPRLVTYSVESFMTLDQQTRRNLELFQSGLSGTTENSLLSIIDLTKTPMGGRLIKKWLGQPLLDIKALDQRQVAVDWFVSNTTRRIEMINSLGHIADLERLINRIKTGIAIPRELLTLRRSLETIPQIKAIIQDEPVLAWLTVDIKSCREVVELISAAIIEDSTGLVGGGGVIKTGFSSELDQVQSVSGNARKYLTELEQREREKTGIKSLKVGYNRVFGYYLEVTSSHLGSIPEDYIRKQTLVGAERFFTPELKEYESMILNAQERIGELENSLYRQVCRQISSWAERIRSMASALANLDVMVSFGEAAVLNNYVKPQLSTGDAIQITGGRHPVVEQVLLEEGFVPNDTNLSNDESQLIVLTGPNMAGKSTYLRQVALIVLMAQIGSYVPCDSATIGLVDRIFTRVGLMDDLSTGRSTFMIEMTETANILNNATEKSLIILDEIGRGTSTYDGMSIAHAVVEFIHNSPYLGSKTIFATHYHELVELSKTLPRVRNFNVMATEDDGRVVFLRKVLPGGADKSYGIHVASLAGLPKSVVRRAEEILIGLENGRSKFKVEKKKASTGQLALFETSAPVIGEIRNLDIDSLTPLEAMNKLAEFKKKLQG